MKVEVSYQVIETVEIENGEKYKPLLEEDDYKLRMDLENELYNCLSVKRDSVRDMDIQSCYAIEIDGIDGYDDLLFEY